MKKSAGTESNVNEHTVALYTKYRPQSFAQVLGQDHITDVLADSIKMGKLAHAYLFTGSRGTGKTSVARIFAREIGTTDRDLFEIDAASNNSVENVRDLTESVNVLPFDSKYKVYILDEVHMLSKSAFNALLKTLEEPPRHVIFILATTEVHKLPETVISRCEQYHFKTPNREILKKMVIATAKKEGFAFEPAAAELIAVLGDGSFRDTHTILQKLFRTSADATISLAEVERVTGAPKNALVNDCFVAFVTGDVEKGLGAIKTASDNNLDAKVFMKLVLEKYRYALLMRVAPAKKELFADAVSDDDAKLIADVVAAHATGIDSAKMSRLIDAMNDIGHSYIPYLPIELAMVEVAGKK